MTPLITSLLTGAVCERRWCTPAVRYACRCTALGHTSGFEASLHAYSDRAWRQESPEILDTVRTYAIKLHSTEFEFLYRDSMDDQTAYVLAACTLYPGEAVQLGGHWMLEPWSPRSPAHRLLGWVEVTRPKVGPAEIAQVRLGVQGRLAREEELYEMGFMP
jgi:hypothetical protein